MSLLFLTPQGANIQVRAFGLSTVWASWVRAFWGRSLHRAPRGWGNKGTALALTCPSCGTYSLVLTFWKWKKRRFCRRFLASRGHELTLPALLSPTGCSSPPCSCRRLSTRAWVRNMLEASPWLNQVVAVLQLPAFCPKTLVTTS